MRYLLLLIFLVGCATLSSTGKIIKTEKGVEFETDRPAKMSMKKGDTEYIYDSQSESWFSKVMGILTLGAMGAK